MYQVLLSTTGSQTPVVLTDLSGREFTHPTIDFNLLDEYFMDEIQLSSDLQTALTNNWITLTYGGYTVSSIIDDMQPIRGLVFEEHTHTEVDITDLNHSGSGDIVVLFTEKKSYSKFSHDVWTIMAYIMFRGTTALGTPSAIKVISWNRDLGDEYDISIKRQDTGQTICSISNQTNVSPEIKDLGTLSNLPSGETILEVQAKVSMGGPQGRISSLIIEF